MRELSLNILDISQNSLTAGAKLIRISVEADTERDLLAITIEDDGEGMEGWLVERASDPFVTTRKTRPVGMGLPLFKQAAELIGGRFEIRSKKGEGTVVRAQFIISSIDRMPLGSIEDTVTALLQSGAEIELEFTVDGRGFRFDSEQIKRELDADDISDWATISCLKEYIKENIQSVLGGVTL